MSKSEPFDFEFDFFEGDDIQKAVESTQSPETEAPNPPEPSAEVVEDQEIEAKATETEEEVDLEGYSDAAKYALAAQAKKDLPEDLVIPKDLTFEGILDLLQETANKRLEAEKEEFFKNREKEAAERLAEKGLTESHLTYWQQVQNGANPQIVSQAMQLRSWAEAEPETENEYEQVILAGLKIKHNAFTNPENQEVVDLLFEKHVKGQPTSVLQQKAAEYQEYFGKLADNLEKQENDRIKAIEEERKAEEAQYSSDVENQVKTGFYGVELKPTKQKELIDYMTKKTETVEIDTPNGKKRIKVTKEEADRRKDAADIQKRVFEAHQRMEGYGKLVNTVRKNETQKFLKGIGNTEPKNNTQPTSSDSEIYMEFEI